MTRLQEKYEKEIIPAMIEKFGYKNIMEVPRLEKIVINMGVGEAKENQSACGTWRGRRERNGHADLQGVDGEIPD